MVWLRIDDGFAQHPKVAGLTDAELGGWLRLACWCASSGTEGAVPSEVALRITRRRTLEALWRSTLIESGANGWQLHDWLDYQPSNAEIARIKGIRAEAGRAGGVAKAKQSASNLLSKSLAKVCPGPGPGPDLPENSIQDRQGDPREPLVFGPKIPESLHSQALRAIDAPHEWQWVKPAFDGAIQRVTDGWRIFTGKPAHPAPQTHKACLPILQALADGRTAEEIRDALIGAAPDCWARGKGLAAALANIDGLAPPPAAAPKPIRKIDA